MKIKFDHPDAQLCYVLGYEESMTAVFTTQPLEQQTGDDWDDTPYEHNAGSPYGPRGEEHWDLVSVRFYHPYWKTPAGRANAANSRWSVDLINQNKTPWLSGWSDHTETHGSGAKAGCSLREFLDILYETGGFIRVDVGRREDIEL